MSSHQLSNLSQSTKIVKSIDVDVTREQRSASDEELVYPHRRY